MSATKVFVLFYDLTMFLITLIKNNYVEQITNVYNYSVWISVLFFFYLDLSFLKKKIHSKSSHNVYVLLVVISREWYYLKTLAYPQCNLHKDSSLNLKHSDVRVIGFIYNRVHHEFNKEK